MKLILQGSVCIRFYGIFKGEFEGGECYLVVSITESWKINENDFLSSVFRVRKLISSICSLWYLEKLFQVHPFDFYVKNFILERYNVIFIVEELKLTF